VAQILLVDDDPLITGPVTRALESAGYDVSVAHEGDVGLDAALNDDPDLVVLDVLMPGMDGWTVCTKLRAQRSVPILMLTAMSDETDRILGLELGADDYLTKPFSTRELLARVKALLRRVELDRTQEAQDGLITVGELVMDLDTRRAYKADEEITLRYKEFELLKLLLARAGEVITRPELFDEVWGTDWLGDTRTLDVHIRWLREKVEDDPGNPRYIETVRGVGYRLNAPGGAS
jgi:DNA-binding response OmpR family regulator